MKITWLGHAAFLILSENGQKILTDPYEAGSYGGALAYQPINEEADIVTVSHQHADHYHPKGLKGQPEIITGSGVRTVGGFSFKGISTFHDPSEGTQRGDNTVFVFTVDDITLCHLGDLGHALSEDQTAEIGDVDVVLVPVGGLYTIDSNEATEIINTMAPKIVIPMHYKTSKCGFDIAGVDDFLRGKENVERITGSEISLTKADLPRETHIKVLEHKL
ncbi:MAG: MBL fold metallo-hydrolase [Gemmatimonadota bacterium]|nr:MAG: MBL fold metallo-hydrolase [Gemmatimonadota bacterium]